MDDFEFENLQEISYAARHLHFVGEIRSPHGGSWLCHVMSTIEDALVDSLNVGEPKECVTDSVYRREAEQKAQKRLAKDLAQASEVRWALFSC